MENSSLLSYQLAFVGISWVQKFFSSVIRSCSKIDLPPFVTFLVTLTEVEVNFDQMTNSTFCGKAKVSAQVSANLEANSSRLMVSVLY